MKRRAGPPPAEDDGYADDDGYEDEMDAGAWEAEAHSEPTTELASPESDPEPPEASVPPFQAISPS